jgi:hypothetical protein
MGVPAGLCRTDKHVGIGYRVPSGLCLSEEANIYLIISWMMEFPDLYNKTFVTCLGRFLDF